MKKIFILKASKAKTSKDFSLNDLPGDGGRMDIVARCVNSAFFLSHDLRKDTEFIVVLEGGPDPPVTLRFVGSKLKYLSPDERCTGGLIKKALEKVTAKETESTPGIFVSKKSFLEVINELEGELVYLHENGEDIQNVDFDSDKICFVLGDHLGLSQDDESLLKTAKRVSISPMVLHADHCIIIVHNVFDRKNL
ncbi:MAG: tRNA (pseudouridine(54)-N(1))-methyltransferase [Candidatus Methanofastidiosum methylothiophilum]|uniref:tRNA (pseudouridine(54)-N(1))-methyltransferase n=1 Tax=Candidatus Methanofastidiosum methylothiophilum TaxID=1705564 RepID=A0A150IK75_9EURY|nr:MAG: tRNA (pseudouridine(54)-N(1))-methyltransferase [Candidatus Methanofastidiosum methylthiophilus]KYC48460.1 MAG: tRNA (pseudouridine(54)-N(1))-methyltransferase [Candidatus Methanofastidiosum methylthiophilus]KYC49902.1 MAG: tRNA (pseudouridine(54)-N(1))-methyltransferase [Candidatus Methanofastidiosum methylthiophilus]